MKATELLSEEEEEDEEEILRKRTGSFACVLEREVVESRAER